MKTVRVREGEEFACYLCGSARLWPDQIVTTDGRVFCDGVCAREHLSDATASRSFPIAAADLAVLATFGGRYAAIAVVSVSDDDWRPSRGRVWRYSGHDVQEARRDALRRQNGRVYVRRDGQWAAHDALLTEAPEV